MLLSDFFNFLVWVLLVFLIFVLVVGFNRQMMEKNRLRDEQIAKRKEAKGKNEDKVDDNKSSN
ncbi:hypothetical protein IO424_001442 [Campylobacter fetus]|nr:hypothetical protein [Campylobacter fetus]WKW18093.1 hypothetical protein IXZ25_04365 [Campylobacter fetus subsp. fetus]EAJ5704590.1 hypothetical protein [Campylobacter fetus]EAJ9256196.1 hypothetical protein [Campylobacter fetus]EAK0814609.1 hypothetical protein [Campylobacter fetus]